MLYVEPRALGLLISAWIERWEIEYAKPPPEPFAFADEPRGVDPSLSPIEALVERTERAGRRVDRRRIWEILSGTHKRIRFYETADPLICAMGCPAVFYDGTLPVLGHEALALELEDAA